MGSQVNPYLVSLREFPVLSRAEEQRLMAIMRRPAPPEANRKAFEQDKREKDEARSWFIKCNLSLVIKFAQKFARYYCLDFDDMIQEGNLILMRTVEMFDPGRGFKFSTYACRAIIQEFLRLVADKNKKITKARAVLRNELEREPSAGEIAQRSDCTLKVVKFALQRSLSVLTLDEELHDACEVVKAPWAELENRELIYQIAQEVEKGDLELSDNHKKIFFDRIGFTPDGSSKEPKTLEQVGHRFGFSKERARQITKSVRGKLVKAGWSINGREQVAKV